MLGDVVERVAPRPGDTESGGDKADEGGVLEAARVGEEPGGSVYGDGPRHGTRGGGARRRGRESEGEEVPLAVSPTPEAIALSRGGMKPI